jgi:glutathione S-transferase
MPPLVNKYVFSMAPAKAPFFIRPLLRAALSTLDARLVMDPLKRNLKYVHRPLPQTCMFRGLIPTVGRGHT